MGFSSHMTKENMKQKGEVMGMWIELGIFVLVLLFGLHQIWDVKTEQRKRSQQKSDPES